MDTNKHELLFKDEAPKSQIPKAYSHHSRNSRLKLSSPPPQKKPWRSWRLGGSKKPSHAPQKPLCLCASVVKKNRAAPSPKNLCPSVDEKKPITYYLLPITSHRFRAEAVPH